MPCSGRGCPTAVIQQGRQSFNNGNGGLEAAPVPGTGTNSQTFSVPSGQPRMGRGVGGASLNDVLLIGGDDVSGRGPDGVFRDLVITDGRLGYIDHGQWKEFPQKTVSDLLSLVNATPALANSAMGRSVLAAYSPDGSPTGQAPATRSLTLPSKVSSTLFTGDLLLDPNEPIKGRGIDNVFRPIVVREDGQVGYWSRGWKQFPAKTRQALEVFLKRNKREGEPGAKWLFEDTTPTPGPGPVETETDTTPAPSSTLPSPTKKTTTTHGDGNTDETSGRSPASDKQEPKDIVAWLLRTAQVPVPSLSVEDLKSKFGLTPAELLEKGFQIEIDGSKGDYSIQHPVDPAKRLYFSLKKPSASEDEGPAGDDPETTSKESIDAGKLPTGQVLDFATLGVGEPSIAALKALLAKVKNKRLHVLFSSSAPKGTTGYCEPCERLKNSGKLEKFAKTQGDDTFVLIEGSSIKAGTPTEQMQELTNFFSLNRIPYGIVMDRQDNGSFSNANSGSIQRAPGETPWDYFQDFSKISF